MMPACLYHNDKTECQNSQINLRSVAWLQRIKTNEAQSSYQNQFKDAQTASVHTYVMEKHTKKRRKKSEARCHTVSFQVMTHMHYAIVPDALWA